MRAIHRAGPILIALACLIPMGCDRGVDETRRARQEPETEATGAAALGHDAGNLRRLSTDEITPELKEAADAILQKHGDQPLGSSVAFSHQGKRYVARLEEHYHPPGAPGPDGEHKGVSLFLDESTR